LGFQVFKIVKILNIIEDSWHQMENNIPKIDKKANQIEEFVDYDQKGEAVVLRRSTQHPGTETSEEKPNNSNSSKAPTQNRFSQMAANRGAGSLRFFGDVNQVAGSLKSKNTPS
jgi:hypothetical protein